jgi:hypothetical protein
MAADPPNETLSQLLACLSWSGERLAREICRVLGTGAVHPTAPYKWLKDVDAPRGTLAGG